VRRPPMKWSAIADFGNVAVCGTAEPDKFSVQITQHKNRIQTTWADHDLNPPSWCVSILSLLNNS
jgi:hypothetical protein